MTSQAGPPGRLGQPHRTTMLCCASGSGSVLQPAVAAGVLPNVPSQPASQGNGMWKRLHLRRTSRGWATTCLSQKGRTARSWTPTVDAPGPLQPVGRGHALRWSLQKSELAKVLVAVCITNSMHLTSHLVKVGLMWARFGHQPRRGQPRQKQHHKPEARSSGHSHLTHTRHTLDPHLTRT